MGISAATARKRVQRILGDMRETIFAKRKKGTTMLVATVAALILSMFFAEDVEAAVVPAGLSSKVAAVEACSEAAAGTGKTAISILTDLSTKKTIVIALIDVLALSGGIASVPGCGETTETETPKPTRKATPTPTPKATTTPKQETPKQEIPVQTKTPTTAPATHTHTWVENTRTVTDKAAWDEQVQVSEAYDEPVIEGFYTCNICGYQIQDAYEPVPA